MPLPTNIPKLLGGETVEWDRLEFKEGWNPQEVIQTISAFANDFHNWGGGYLIIGVKEHDGKPIFPPIGITPESADKIQKELLQHAYRIQPNYHPICEPYTLEGKLVLVIWAPAGEMRPYKAPLSLSDKKAGSAYFIRINANTVRATRDNERELVSLANRIPFDDRQHPCAEITALNPSLIQSHLHNVGSELTPRALSIPLEDLGRKLQVIRGVPEAPRPLNVGLLFFNEEPRQWFPQTQIDIVHMPQGPGGDQLIERTFTGPLGNMLKDALTYLRNQFVAEHIIKHPDKAEANRFYNIPYTALEEALVNAVYHRSYEEREPIEIRITPEEVTILSFPGPDETISMDELVTGRAIARRYRNRRIGEFLKELELSEGRGTGIPKILAAMETNGSPAPTFDTDPGRISLLVRLPIHKDTPANPDDSDQARDQARDQVKQLEEKDLEKNNQARDQARDQAIILGFCAEPKTLSELLIQLKRTSRVNFKTTLINPLLTSGLLAMTHPKSPTHPKQAYYTTKKGNKHLED